MKYLISILFFLSSFFAYSQEKKSIVDTTNATLELNLSKKLQYKDALSARDITYKWTNKLGRTKYYKLKAAFHLQHAINDQVCGSLVAGIEVYSRAINTALLYDSTSLILAEAYARRGNALNIKGESQLGLKELFKAQKIYKYHHKTEEILWCDAFIADCYRQQNSLIKAHQKIEISIKKLENYKPSLLLLDAYYIYGNIVLPSELRQKKTLNFSDNKLAYYLNKSLQYAQKIKNKPYQGKALKLLSGIKYLKQENEKSLQLAKKAATYFKETNFLIDWVGAKFSESRSLVRLGRHEEVIKTLEAPVDLAAKSGWLTELNQMYSFLAISHATLGHHREGAINGSRAFTIYKHIVKETREYEMETLEANYEKEQQIEATKTAKKELKLKQEQHNLVLIILALLLVIVLVIVFFYRKINQHNKLLNSTLKQKEILLQEVHHRVKNNLTLLKSLLFLRAKASDDPNVKLILNECEARVQSMALVHQNLYDVDDASVVNFNSFLEQLVYECNALFGEKNDYVSTTITTNSIQFDMSFTVFLGLIINELITNSYKYAFNSNTKNHLAITLVKEGDNYVLTYTDSGNGLPPNFKLDTSGGFGFKLINIMLSQIDATIAYNNNTFTIVFTT